MKPQIVVIGSANTDMIVKTTQIPRVGETVLGENFIQSMGGKGANQAVAAAPSALTLADRRDLTRAAALRWMIFRAAA